MTKKEKLSIQANINAFDRMIADAKKEQKKEGTPITDALRLDQHIKSYETSKGTLQWVLDKVCK